MQLSSLAREIWHGYVCSSPDSHLFLNLQQIIMNSFPCGVCPKSFILDWSFQEHAEAVHSFYCDLCDVYFGDESLTGNHDDGHVLWCRIYNRQFASQIQLDSHNRAVHPSPCSTCGETFRSERQLEIHFESTSHPVPRDSISTQHQNSPHIYLCKICKGKWATREELLTHQAELHLFKCGNCTQVFETYDAYSKHQKNTHKHQCTKCRAIFSKARSLKKHQDLHANICPKCLAKFRTSKLLFQHAKVHQRLPCSKCAEFFCSLDLLRSHEMTHVSKCPTCEAVFDNKDSLRNHRYLHFLAEIGNNGQAQNPAEDRAPRT